MNTIEELKEMSRQEIIDLWPCYSEKVNRKNIGPLPVNNYVQETILSLIQKSFFNKNKKMPSAIIDSLADVNPKKIRREKIRRKIY